MLVHQIIPKLETFQYKSWWMFKPRYFKDEVGTELVKRELLVISDFSEYYDQDGNVDSNRCLVRTDDGWIEVNESFEEVRQMVTKTEFKGYGKNL